MNIKARFAELWNPEDVLDSLWRTFASPYTTMLLLTGVAALVCLGIFVPQRPADAAADPTANSLWLASLRERYGSTIDWLVGLRLVDVHRSMLLRGLVGLLAFNLLLGTADFIRPRHLLPASLAGSTTLSGGPPLAETHGQFLKRLKELLRNHHYRLREGSNGDWLYADRFALFPILVYMGLLLTIGGLALSERTAWWEEGVTLRPGQLRPLGHGTALSVRAQASEASYDPLTGQWHEGHMELTFLREDQEIGQQVLHDHAPSFYAGLLFYLTSTEPALLIQAQDNAGRNLVLQTPETGATQFTEVVLRFRQEESPQYIIVLDLRMGSPLGRRFEQKGNERYVLVPSRALSLRLLYSPPGPGEGRPTFLVEAFRSGETSPFYQHQFNSANSVEIAGDRYTFQPQRCAVIKFGQDHSMALIFAGAVLMLTGIVLSAWHHPRRIWMVAQFADGELNLHFMAAPAGGKAPRWFEDLMQSIATALALKVQSIPAQELTHLR